MQIQINSTRENEDDQTVYFTITDDFENEYQWHGDFPKGIDLEAHLERQKERLLLGIRRKEYPGAKFDICEDQTELEAFDEWIKDGCMLRDSETGQYTDMVEKVPFKGTHPTQLQWGERIDGAKSLGALKEVIKEILVERS